jgi:hypothetical protein
MDDIAKSERGRKPFHPDDMVYDHDGEVVLEDTLENTIENREGGPLPHNPPPGPKWQAKQGMARLHLNGAEYSVLACLIDRASKNKGACYPSQEFISRWTFRPLRTVERAIATLNHKGAICSIPRGTTSNAYIIHWKPLFAAYRQMKALECHGDSDLTKSGGSIPVKSGGSYPPEVAAEPMKGTYEEEPMARSEVTGVTSSESLLIDVKKIEEAIQGEQGKDSESQPTTPAKPSYVLLSFWGERHSKASAELAAETDPDRRAELEAKVARCLAKLTEVENG